MVRHARTVFARSLARGTLAAPDLAVVPAEARFAATLVDPLALSLVQTRDHAFGKFTAQPVVPFGALALVLLDAFASVEALFRTNSTLAVPSLVSERAGTVPGGGTVAPVHTLRVAERRLAVLAHVPFGANADLVLVADAPVGALFVTLRVGSWRRESRRSIHTSMCTFLTQFDSQGSPGDGFALATLNQQADAENCDSGHVAGARQCHTKLLGILRDPSAGFDRNSRWL